ncbi:MAG: hypothetical protein WBQ75_03095 [Acetobacteraceae bacterium]
MRTFILTSAALAFAAAAPAFAATNTTTGPAMNQSGVTGSTNGSAEMNNPAGGPGSAALQSKIHSELSQAGFTNIHVMPQSFLVRAKDSSGNPVMMVINPDSVTAVTRMGGASASQSAQNGASGTSGAMGSSTMNDSAHAGGAINSPNGNGTTVH